MSISRVYVKNELKPLYLWQLGAMFGVPALLMVISVYILLPSLIKWGLSEYMSLFLASLVTFLGLFTASLIAYRIEGAPWKWMAFKVRFRLGDPQEKTGSGQQG